MTNFVYIENYFKGEFTPEENGTFDQKVKNDSAFAEEVAFYCSALHVIKSELSEEKKNRFRKLYEESKVHHLDFKSSGIKKWWPYVAAAAVVAGLIFGMYTYFKPSSLQQMADQYIQQQFVTEMGVKMAGSTDSLDAAIHLYNEGKLREALQQFEKIIQSGSTAGLPKQMAGIVTLRLGEYDKAIDYFSQLENMALYSNPGKLYHALALIKRNRPGDKETVKQLLKQVVEGDMEGKETAQKWMESL